MVFVRRPSPGKIADMKVFQAPVFDVIRPLPLFPIVMRCRSGLQCEATNLELKLEVNDATITQALIWTNQVLSGDIEDDGKSVTFEWSELSKYHEYSGEYYNTVTIRFNVCDSSNIWRDILKSVSYTDTQGNTLDWSPLQDPRVYGEFDEDGACGECECDKY